MILAEFVLGMIDLYDNINPVALYAKMVGIKPTTEQGIAQRDAINKLGGFLAERSISHFLVLLKCSFFTNFIPNIYENSNLYKQIWNISYGQQI
jgi:hypothetical protein